jgi:hypothetical protein
MMHDTHGVSGSRSCAAVGFARSAYYHKPVDWQVRAAEVIEALNEWVEVHP